MAHHPIFDTFRRNASIGTGKHVFDFLGVATNTAYKKGWHKHAPLNAVEVRPAYPAVNEHYFDWIALLECVRSASGTFRMAELGAGWAPWLVRAVFAARQIPSITDFELVGVEADPTHYDWAVEHCRDNGLNPNNCHLLHGAISPHSTILKFPKISNPDEDYGVSLGSLRAGADYVEVQGVTLTDVLNRFSGPLNFLHMDIQGAEYDVIPNEMDLLKNKVKAMMVGTHRSQEKHLELANLFHKHGWKPIMLYPRNEEVVTEWGTVRFGDGFQFWRNPASFFIE